MNVVVVGGGHGAAASLRACLRYAASLAGIITVADDGGSAGRLAAEYGVLPMGDIRNCLVAVAPDSPAAGLFQYRFAGGGLDGHVVGNLVIAARALETGEFMSAVEYAGELLGSRARIVPPTLEPVRLVAEAGGRLLEGQVAVARAPGPISRVRLDPAHPKAHPGALDLLAAADQIVLGPGSLFTSVLPSLLVPEVREAYLAAKARKVLVCNLTAPPGETHGLDAAGHVAAVRSHVGEGAVDTVVVHRGRPPAGSRPVALDAQGVRSLGVEVVTGDLLPDDGTPRHDPHRLAAVLRGLPEPA